MSTRVDGTTMLVTVSARALLSAGPLHMSLSAHQGSTPGTWRYNLNDGTDNRAAHGQVASHGTPSCTTSGPAPRPPWPPPRPPPPGPTTRPCWTSSPGRGHPVRRPGPDQRSRPRRVRHSHPLPARPAPGHHLGHHHPGHPGTPADPATSMDAWAQLIPPPRRDMQRQALPRQKEGVDPETRFRALFDVG
jgi:hypothetical protein